MHRDTQKTEWRDKLIEDLSLVYPESKEVIPEMVDFMESIGETGIYVGYEEGFKKGQQLARYRLLSRTFCVFFTAPFFLMFGEMAVGTGLLAVFVAAVAGTTMWELFQHGLDLLKPKTKEEKQND